MCGCRCVCVARAHVPACVNFEVGIALELVELESGEQRAVSCDARCPGFDSSYLQIALEVHLHFGVSSPGIGSYVSRVGPRFCFVFVCARACVRVRECVCLSACVPAVVFCTTRPSVSVRLCAHACAYACARALVACLRVCARTCLRVCMCMRARACVCVCVRARVRVRAYAPRVCVRVLARLCDSVCARDCM